MVRAPLDSHVAVIAPGVRIVGRAIEISRNDICLELPEAPRIGSEVFVHVILPFQLEVLVIPGMVRTAKGDQVEIHFGALPPKLSRAIRYYVETKVRSKSGTRTAVESPETETDAIARRRG